MASRAQCCLSHASTSARRSRTHGKGGVCSRLGSALDLRPCRASAEHFSRRLLPAQSGSAPVVATSAPLLVLVVQVPPLVWRCLRVALRRVLPLLLAPESGQIEVAPGAAHRLIAAVVDEA